MAGDRILAGAIAACLASAFAHGATIEQVTATTIVAPIDSNSNSIGAAALSPDARFALYFSDASNLVPGDTNRARDAFVYDHQTGAVTRESVSSSGAQAPSGVAYGGSVSADGRFVVFSTASSLVSDGGDTNGLEDVYLRDRQLGTTTLVSQRLAGDAAGNGRSLRPDISSDGNFVVFESCASDLVASDTNGACDVFRWTRAGGARELASRNGATAGNGRSHSASVSADGRYVAYASAATNLASDANLVDDVFVTDLVTGTAVRASVSDTGAELSSGSVIEPGLALSEDGEHVVFVTAAPAVAADTNGVSDAFRRSIGAGVTVRASVTTAGAQVNAAAVGAVVSGDGNRVAWTSSASALVAFDTNNVADAFLRDISGSSTVRTSVSASGNQLVRNSIARAISGDGTVVTFQTPDGLAAAGDANVFNDVFRRDLVAGTSVRASPPVAGSSGAFPDGDAFEFGIAGPSISADGRFVVFSSRATNLVPGDTNGAYDVFLRDRELGTNTRISVTSTGAQVPFQSESGTITPDGRYVVFAAGSPLVPLDTNNQFDVYRWERATGTLVLASVADDDVTAGNGGSFTPDISDDGTIVLFTSCASNLVAGDTNARCDVFVRDLGAATTTLASRTTGGAPGNGDSQFGWLSGDGRTLCYSSLATNLVAGDTNGVQDGFVVARGSTAVERMTLGAGGGQLDRLSGCRGLSRDGRVAIFFAAATNVVPEVTVDTREHIYVRDRDAGTTVLASRRDDGTPLDGTNHDSAISPDGRLVSFVSLASNHGPAPDPTGIAKLFVHDRVDRRLALVGTNSGALPNNFAENNQFSSDGNEIVFYSFASNLVEEEGNGNFLDVFVARDLLTRVTQTAALSIATPATDDEAGRAVAIGDGVMVVGTPGRDVGASPERGSVEVFVYANGAWSRAQTLNAGDGAAGDRFGAAVAVRGDGDVIVVGAPGADQPGAVGAGAAYAFVRSGAFWNPVATLAAIAPEAGAAFGTSVSLSADGSVLLVGAPAGNGGRGIVYPYSAPATASAAQRGLGASGFTPATPVVRAGGAIGDKFGQAVATTGGIAVIGAPGASGADGVAVVVADPVTGATPLGELGPSGAAPADAPAFGASVSIDGNDIAIGAPEMDVDEGGPQSDRGVVATFEIVGGVPAPVAVLSSPQGGIGDKFGSAVSTSGGVIAVGTPFGTSLGAEPGSGFVSVFRGDRPVSGVRTWSLDQELASAASRGDDAFGASVAVHAGRIAVGAPQSMAGAAVRAGSAAIYERTVTPEDIFRADFE